MAGQEHFWDVFRRSPTAVLLLDDAGVCRDVNDAGERALARERAEIVGRHVVDLPSAEQRPRASELWAQARPAGHFVTSWEVRRPGVRLPGIIVLARTRIEGASFYVLALVEESAVDGTTILSPREREVTRLLAAGLSGEEIARELVLSPETVRTHIRNAMEGMGARTRAHLVALAMRGPPR